MSVSQDSVIVKICADDEKANEWKYGSLLKILLAFQSEKLFSQLLAPKDLTTGEA